MARTTRKGLMPYRCFRNPHHFSEEAKLRQILNDARLEGWVISGVNRIHKRLTNLPNAWDDIPVAALSEEVRLRK